MRPAAPAVTLCKAPPSDLAVRRPPRPAQVPNRHHLDRLDAARLPHSSRYSRSPRTAAPLTNHLRLPASMGMMMA